MSILNQEEIKAVKFYEGDIAEEDKSDSFWGDPKIYCSLNALLFRALSTEYTRVNEGKVLNTAIFGDYNRLLSVYRNLLTASKKGTLEYDILSYRVERAKDFEQCQKAGKTIAFTSTSTDGFLKEYGDKKDIVLLTYHIPAGTPLIIFEQLLDKYLKNNEKELLLPPHIHFSCKKREFDDTDLTIRDMNGNAPIAAYDLFVHQEVLISGTYPNSTFSDPFENGKSIWEQLNTNKSIEGVETGTLCSYLLWKQKLINEVLNMASEIWDT